MRYGFRLYAHRGARLVAPENTAAAFRRALADGANALELDVHGSADDEIVVIHDRDGRRVAGENQLVRRLKLDELKRWQLPYPAGAGRRTEFERVPTLSEILEEFADVPMSVDLKPNSPHLARLLVDCVMAHDAAGWVTLASFHHQVVRAIRRLGYPGRTTLSRPEVALLRLAAWSPPVRRLIGGHAAQIPLRAGPLRLDRLSFVRRARAQGLRVDFWVVNRIEKARALRAQGATGVFTDDPGALAPLLDEEQDPGTPDGA